jgi:hypothetical protein
MLVLWRLFAYRRLRRLQLLFVLRRLWQKYARRRAVARA